MKWWKCFLIVVLAFYSMQNYSQRVANEDVVVLENGNEIRGKIIQSSPGRYYILEKNNGERVEIYVADISKVIRADKKSDKTSKDKDALTKRFHTAFEPGLHIITDDIVYNNQDLTSGKSVYFTAYLVNSFVIKKKSFTTGLGTGIESLPQAYNIPVFLDIRKYFGKGKTVPLLIADVGYGFGWQKPEANLNWVGLFYEPAVGLLIKNESFMDLYFRIGYKHQNFKVDKAYKTKKMSADFITIRVGVFFR